MVASEPKGVIIGPTLAPMSAARTVPIWACERKSTLRAINAAGRLFTIFEANAVAPAAVRSFSADPALISRATRTKAHDAQILKPLHGDE